MRERGTRKKKRKNNCLPVELDLRVEPGKGDEIGGFRDVGEGEVALWRSGGRQWRRRRWLRLRLRLRRRSRCCCRRRCRRFRRRPCRRRRCHRHNRNGFVPCLLSSCLFLLRNERWDAVLSRRVHGEVDRWSRWMRGGGDRSSSIDDEICSGRCRMSNSSVGVDVALALLCRRYCCCCCCSSCVAHAVSASSCEGLLLQSCQSVEILFVFFRVWKKKEGGLIEFFFSASKAWKRATREKENFAFSLRTAFFCLSFVHFLFKNRHLEGRRTMSSSPSSNIFRRKTNLTRRRAR